MRPPRSPRIHGAPSVGHWFRSRTLCVYSAALNLQMRETFIILVLSFHVACMLLAAEQTKLALLGSTEVPQSVEEREIFAS